jgi:hypothetical protein
MLISSSIPNLVNGVSQQPDALRLASQSDAQENFLSSVVEGLKRRPGSNHLSKLTDSSWSEAFLHTINRDSNERYAVVILNGDLKVFDLFTGDEVTVSFPNGKDYLTVDNKNQFRVVTIADYSFIVNSSKTVEMGPELTASRPAQTLISITGGNYSKTFEIDIDGVNRASYATPDGTDDIDVERIGTEHIATQLYNDLIVSLNADWEIVQYKNVIAITHLPGNEFEVTTSDSFNGGYMRSTPDRVQSFSDLPPHAPPGFVCEIVGEASSSFDNYYVEWVSGTNDYTEGVWKETVKWNIPYRYDPSTMPHILVREADGSFTFQEAEWGEREVGDADSAPNGSFVGRQLNDIFFFKNRLGLTADENVIMSRAGSFFNFWPETVTTLLDSDPIDIAVSHVKVSTINHAVPFNSSLLLFSDQTQFVLSGGSILTPSTVNVAATTEFEGSDLVRPVGAGPNVYFPVTRGSYSGIREYYVEADTLTNNASDITSHCPKYLPGNLTHLASSSNEDMIVGLSPDEPSSLYVYKYFHGQQGKLQSSWSKWTFADGDNILHVAFISSKMYLIIERSDGVYLEEIDVEAGAADEDTDIHYRVDRKLYETDVVSTVYEDGYTTWTLPYTEDEPLWLFVRAGDAVRSEAYIIKHDRPTSDTIRARGDYSDVKVCIGRRYNSSYKFSTFLIKEEATGGGQVSIGEGRLQITHLALDYDQTGYFEVEVLPRGRDAFNYKFTGRILGAIKNVIGEVSLEEGRFKFPVLSRNTHVDITINSDHFLPCSFMAAEWEGRYNARTRRL